MGSHVINQALINEEDVLKFYLLSLLKTLSLPSALIATSLGISHADVVEMFKGNLAAIPLDKMVLLVQNIHHFG